MFPECSLNVQVQRGGGGVHAGAAHGPGGGGGRDRPHKKGPQIRPKSGHKSPESAQISPQITQIDVAGPSVRVVPGKAEGICLPILFF
jgi:hypothetical protein